MAGPGRVHVPSLCGDLKTEESDDCHLGDCAEPEGLCLSSHQGLITADCWCWLHRQTPGVWLDLPLECQVSQRLSPLCKSAWSKLSLSEDDIPWHQCLRQLNCRVIYGINLPCLLLCLRLQKLTLNWTFWFLQTLMVQQQSLLRAERHLGSLCIQLYRMLRSVGTCRQQVHTCRSEHRHTDDLEFVSWPSESDISQGVKKTCNKAVRKTDWDKRQQDRCWQQMLISK